MLWPRCLVVILVSAILISCAHGVVTELPTSPTPAVTIKSLTITPVGGGSLIAGQSAPITSSGPFQGSGGTLGAFAQYTDGSGKYVEATWTTSDAAVVVVNDGSLVGMARGTARLTARAEGMSATEMFNVEPNMAGTWSGKVVIDECAAGSGSMSELVCGNAPGRPPGLAPVGMALPIAFQIQKNGGDLTATAQIMDVSGILRGLDRGQNFLTLAGDLTINRTTLTVVYWDTRVRTDLMEGFVGFEVRIAGFPSNAAVTAHFDNVTRR